MRGDREDVQYPTRAHAASGPGFLLWGWDAELFRLPPPAGGPPPPPGLPTRQAIFSIQTRQVPMPLATGILHRPYADGGRRGRREVLRFGRATEDMKGQHGSGAGAGAGASPPQAPALTSEADACHPPPAPPPLTAKRLNPTSVTISPGDQDEVPSPHCPSVSLSEKR